MRQKPGTRKSHGEKVVKDIRRATRKQYSAEEKIRIVLDGLKGEDSISELCRREAEIATLRAYMRQRERLTEYAAAHIQHMQKALMEMNLQLHHVVSDITGATGMWIIRAIVDGERDPEVLAAFRDVRRTSSMDTIKAALVGNDREEHVFALTQSLELYDFYKAQIEACDRRLEVASAALTVWAGDDLAPLPKARIKGKQHNAPSFVVRAAFYEVLGTDLTQIHGLGPSLALKLVAECGTDLSAWKSAKHFTSWLCLAPGNKISGGKLLSSRTRRSSSRAAALPRLAAVTIGRSDTALGAFYRRLSSRIGKQKAVTATARKIAVLFQNAVRHGMSYKDQGAAAYDERHRQRVLSNLQRRAKTLGYALAPMPEQQTVSQEIDAAVPEVPGVYLVMDNYATHNTPKLQAQLARRPHWHIHSTPTLSSWINKVERWFAELTRKQLQRGVHRSTAELDADIIAFIEAHNENPKPYRWVKADDEIRASVKRFCQRTQQTLAPSFRFG